jgi:hypothetical protein
VKHGVPAKVVAAAQKFGRILKVDPPLSFRIRDNPSSRWGGRYLYKPGTLVEIQIQKRVIPDNKTLERIVAHEMAHHADFVHQAREITKQPMSTLVSSPVTIRLALAHGDQWQAQADKINRVMGADFVTVFSDSSYVESAVTSKPFYLLIIPLGSQFGIANAVTLTPAALHAVQVLQAQGAKIFKTNDARWRRRGVPHMRSGRVAFHKDQKDLRKLYSSA